MNQTIRSMNFNGIRNKVVFLFIVAYLAAVPGGTFLLNGQVAGNGEEKVLIHINKPVYVAGEMLRYRIYTFNKESGKAWLPSKMLYLVLTDHHGNIAVQWRMNLNKEGNSGSYKLPMDLQGGVYTLTAYTSSMRNDPYEMLHSQNIIISSLSHEFPDTLYIPVLDHREAFNQAFRENNLNISVETNRIYNTGDTAETVISLKKELPGDTACFSISVYLSLPLANTILNDSLMQLERINARVAGAPAGLSTRFYPVENKGYILSGTLTGKSGNAPVAGGRIILSVIDSLFPHARISRTDSNGHFTFYLDKWFDNKELILQKAGTAVEGGVVWEIDRKKLASPGSPYIPLAVRQSEVNAVTTLNESRLIESVYGSQVPPEPAIVIPPGTNYFGPPDMTVKPGDFSDLVNFKEITENILPGVRLVGRNNTYALQIFNVRTGQWPESNMVLLNGVPFNDMNFVSTLGTKDISRIEVITGNYLLGDLTLGGLVSIYTHNHKIPESYLKNRTFIFQNAVVPSDKSNVPIATYRTGNGETHNPDFRVNLLWDPEREITGDQKLVIRFPVSLITGTYDIVVNGLTHKGTVLCGKTSFEVK
jgi:hypothetical protein